MDDWDLRVHELASPTTIDLLFNFHRTISVVVTSHSRVRGVPVAMVERRQRLEG
jgi:hypothetical protein